LNRVIVKNNINQHPNGPDLAIEIPISPTTVITIILYTLFLLCTLNQLRKLCNRDF